MTGTLYIVATPIGNLGDMVPRAVDILQSVDVIAAEDTRHSLRLLQQFGIRRPLISYHEHNEQQRTSELIGRMVDGEQVALITDAGTPLVSDPGFPLVRAAHAAGIAVSPVPGPCAAIAALSASGIACDRFAFEGFLPARRQQRRSRLAVLKDESRTLVFYEAPHRLEGALADLADVFGPERLACLARELTKLHETVTTATLTELCAQVRAAPDRLRGEVVLVVAGAPPASTGLTAESRAAMELLGAELPVKRAATIVAQLYGTRSKTLYDWYVRERPR